MIEGTASKCPFNEMNTPLPKLAAPAQRALASANVTVLEDLSVFTEQQVMDLHGMGKNAMRILKEAMENANVHFARND